MSWKSLLNKVSRAVCENRELHKMNWPVIKMINWINIHDANDKSVQTYMAESEFSGWVLFTDLYFNLIILYIFSNTNLVLNTEMSIAESTKMNQSWPYF